MNEYRIRETGAVVSEQELRALHPEVSLPVPLNITALDFIGVDPVMEYPAPNVNETQVAVRNGVNQDSKGNWVTSWLINNLTPDEINAKITQKKLDKSTEISQACANQILGGQESTALGSAHTYPSKAVDQANLSASILDSLLPFNSSNVSYCTPFWCADSEGNWKWVNHTAAQIQQVGSDVKSAILAAQNKNVLLQQQIQNATTLDELNLIKWD